MLGWFRRIKDPLLRRERTGGMGRSDASQRSHTHKKASTLKRVKTLFLQRDTRPLFKHNNFKGFFLLFLPALWKNPFSRLGPGALTDRKTKTPQPRCSAPPPALLKGTATTRLKQGPRALCLHHLLHLPPSFHASS